MQHSVRSSDSLRCWCSPLHCSVYKSLILSALFDAVDISCGAGSPEHVLSVRAADMSLLSVSRSFHRIKRNLLHWNNVIALTNEHSGLQSCRLFCDTPKDIRKTAVSLLGKCVSHRRCLRLGFKTICVFICSKVLTLEAGQYARFANGTAICSMGDTSVMVTAVAKPKPSTGSFMPLTVVYRQKSAAAGRIPTNFLRRELGKLYILHDNA